MKTKEDMEAMLQAASGKDAIGTQPHLSEFKECLVADFHAITVPTASVTVVGKGWDNVTGYMMVRYRCSKCGYVFYRRFHDAYPEWCPQCNVALRTVIGKVGR